MFNLENRRRVRLMALEAHQVIVTTEKILQRAEELEAVGFGSFDAIHLASAEYGKADIFLTTDDKLLKLAARKRNLLAVITANPVKWLEEVLK